MNSIGFVSLIALTFSLLGAQGSAQSLAPVPSAVRDVMDPLGRGLFAGIRLTEAQRSALRIASKGFAEQVHATIGTQGITRRLNESDGAKFVELRDGLTIKIRAILTPDQRERFDRNLRDIAGRSRRNGAP